MKPIRIAALVVVGAAVVAFAGVGRPDLAGGASEPSGGITVTGTGTVQSVPDQAQFSLGVQTDGPTAREALAANSERMRRVLAALFAAGVAKGDVQTQDVSVSKSYPGNGYSADNSVSVTDPPARESRLDPRRRVERRRQRRLRPDAQRAPTRTGSRPRLSRKRSATPGSRLASSPRPRASGSAASPRSAKAEASRCPSTRRRSRSVRPPRRSSRASSRPRPRSA